MSFVLQALESLLDLRVFLSFLFRLSDPSENWNLEYFGYADFKNLIFANSFALGRRILEIAIFARNTVLQVLIIKKRLKLILLESAWKIIQDKNFISGLRKNLLSKLTIELPLLYDLPEVQALESLLDLIV